MQTINEELHTCLDYQVHSVLESRLVTKLQGYLERRVEHKLFTDLKFLFCNDFCDNLTEGLHEKY